MEAGETVHFTDLEDPVLFPDLVNAGLLGLTDEVLCVNDVIGRQIKNRIDCLTPLKAEMLV